MTQTASALSLRQSLHIDSENTTILSKNTSPADHSNNVFQETSLYHQPTTFVYNNRVSVRFSLKNFYKSHFPLIKGLIEFSRSRNLKFVFNASDKSFETDIPLELVTHLNIFLSKIQSWVNNEIKFKSVLRKVVEFEKRYQADRDQIYDLQRSVLLHS